MSAYFVSTRWMAGHGTWVVLKTLRTVTSCSATEMLGNQNAANAANATSSGPQA